jgi:hypothetical protein
MISCIGFVGLAPSDQNISRKGQRFSFAKLPTNLNVFLRKGPGTPWLLLMIKRKIIHSSVSWFASVTTSDHLTLFNTTPFKQETREKGHPSTAVSSA